MVTDKQSGFRGNVFAIVLMVFILPAVVIYFKKVSKVSSTPQEEKVLKGNEINYERVTVQLSFIDGTTDTLKDLRIYKSDSGFDDENEFALREGTFSYMMVIENGGRWENIASYVKKYDILKRESVTDLIPIAVHPDAP